MKKAFLFFLLIPLFISLAQQKQPGGVEGIKLMDEVAVSFDGTDPKLAGAPALTLEAMVERSDAAPLLLEIPMRKEGEAWKCNLRIDDPKARFVLYRYLSGENKEENERYQYIVTDKSGDAVQGAHLAAGNFWMTGRLADFRRQADLKKARMEYEMEKKLFPESWKASLAIIDLGLREKPDGKGKQDLDKFYRDNKKNQEALSSVIDLYERAGDTLKASEIREDAVKADPTGKIAQLKAAGLLSKEKDPSKRAGMIEKFLNDFPGMEAESRQAWLQNLARAYLQAKEYEKAGGAISKLEKPNPALFNSAAWPLIEKGEKLEFAAGLAGKGVDILRNQTAGSKPTYMRMKDWEENNKYTLAMLLDTYGTGLLKLGRNQEALAAYEEAFLKSEGGDPEMNLNYLKALAENRMHEKGFDLGLEFIRKGKDSPEIAGMMKILYAGKIGAGSAFDSLGAPERGKFDLLMAEAGKIKIEEMRKKIVASRIKADAPGFTLKDMNGIPVSLSSLAGKVVIVDFWATWCGPCKSSFPYLQKVFEKYSGDGRVKFLAVNSWERLKTYDEQLQNAKKFIEENKYTFPVLIDEKVDDQYKVIGDYGVEGIPTKFLIAKSGSIAFKSVGFDGPSMEDELTQQIEILLAE